MPHREALLIVAAWIAAILCFVVAVFQIALGLGAPWGAASWGGKNEGVLPPKLRIRSLLVGIIFYPMTATTILATAGVISADWVFQGAWIMWALTILFGLGAVANLISPSKVERLWTPVALVLAVCCAVIALNVA